MTRATRRSAANRVLRAHSPIQVTVTASPRATVVTAPTEAAPERAAEDEEALHEEELAPAAEADPDFEPPDAATMVTPPVGTPKKRGRPPKAKEQEVIIHADLPCLDFSLTITSGGRNIPFAWFLSAFEWAQAFCHRASMSLERGGNAENLHIQAVFSARVKEEDVEKIKKLIKEALGVKRGDGQKWYVLALIGDPYLVVD